MPTLPKKRKSEKGAAPGGASGGGALCGEMLLVLAQHLTLQHGQLLAVHGARKHGVGDAHHQPRPQRRCQIHLKEQDADDHCHPCHLRPQTCRYYYILLLPKEARFVCRQAAGKAAKIPPLVGAHQIQARPNQAWARSSVFLPQPYACS